MAVEWEMCPDSVIELTRKIVSKHHPHLEDANIGLLFRSKPGSSHGKSVIGKAAKVSDKDKVLMDGLDFIIWLSKPDWLGMGPAEHEALVDHELCHCSGSFEEGWRTRGHDVEEFHEIVRRHGLWRPAVKLMAIAVQERLPLDGDVLEREPRGSVVAANVGPDGTPTIHVDFAKKCKRCGKKGATPGELCLECAADKIIEGAS